MPFECCPETSRCTFPVVDARDEVELTELRVFWNGDHGAHAAIAE